MKNRAYTPDLAPRSKSKSLCRLEPIRERKGFLIEAVSTAYGISHMSTHIPPPFLWMRCALLLMALFVISAPKAKAQNPPKTSWRVQSVSSLHKLTATSPGVLEKFPASPIQMRATRGEWECFQIVVTAGGEPLHDVSVSPSSLATHLGEFIAASNVKLFWENYVLIDHPSGNRRLEKLWWPDALIPIELQPKREVAPNRSVVLWGAVQVPRESAPGEYYGALEIRANGQEKQYLVGLQVAHQELPPLSMRANVAVYYPVLRDWYLKNIGPQSDADWAVQQKRYYDFLLDYGLNAYDLPVSWQSAEADAYLRDPRVRSVRVPALNNPEITVAIQKLKANNALQKAFYYYIDEPPPERFDEIKTTTTLLHALDPNLKHLVTVHPNETLEDAVDIWCPNIGDFFGLGHLDLKALEAQRKKGRETWWYTMVEPKNPYPTWLVDDDAASVRVYGELMARLKINGFVYSMAHGWGPKPLENIRSFADTNGDGTLLYPSEIVGGIGPMPSIRLMLLRDAIEDYELMRLLPDNVFEISPRLMADNRRELFDFWLADPKTRKPKVQWVVPSTNNPSPFILSQTASSETLPIGLHQTVPFATPPRLDGFLSETTWNHNSWLWRGFTRSLIGDDYDFPTTKLYLTHDKTYLYVAFRCRMSTQVTEQNGWTAVDLAPLKADERWRFVVTQKGVLAVEHHTREGKFRVEGLKWQGATKSATGFYDVEMKIPLEIIGGASRFRFNALRRTTHEPSGTRVMLRAYPDADDVFLMPIVTLGNDALKSKTPPGKINKKN